MRKNDLVLINGQIKAILHAEKAKNPSYVHIDWLRFTVFTRNATPSEICFPPPVDFYEDLQEEHYAVASQAAQVAWDVAAILGPDFSVDLQHRKGVDFYAWRYDILRHGSPVGWVGFLSTSKGFKGEAQARTIHTNLEGMACTFASSGWREKMADYIDQHQGLITRIDLAVDFFDGIKNGIERLPDEYKAGVMDHLGQRPAHDLKGTWCFGEKTPNKGRSFYVGTRQSGKQTNVYEKGLQLFGAESGNPWVRFELRYGNQLRLLRTDMLRHPADFFAGASKWHAAILAEAGASAVAIPIKQEKPLPIQTIEAEVERNARWFLHTAGASFRLAFNYLEENRLVDLLEDASAIPGRLKKFSEQELKKVYSNVFKRVSQNGQASAFSFCPV